MERADLEPSATKRGAVPHALVGVEGRQRVRDERHVQTLRPLLDPDHVVGVAVRAEDVREGDAVPRGAVDEILLEAVAVDQDAVAALLVRDEVGVREPAWMLDALDDHENEITLRIPSCASISSKPRLTSSSVSVCDTNGSTSSSPASQRSTSRGPPSPPLTPPNDGPATRRRVIRNRGTTSSVSPFPAAPHIVASPEPSRADSTACRI